MENDEILAVAFQYTIGENVYQVGEFATDGVEATEINVSENNIQIKQHKPELRIELK